MLAIGSRSEQAHQDNLRRGGKIMAGCIRPNSSGSTDFRCTVNSKLSHDAGLSNYAALEAGTKNPSMFFGHFGKSRNDRKRQTRLIQFLLNANPLGKYFRDGKPRGRDAQRKISTRRNGAETNGSTKSRRALPHRTSRKKQ